MHILSLGSFTVSFYQKRARPRCLASGLNYNKVSLEGGTCDAFASGPWEQNCIHEPELTRRPSTSYFLISRAWLSAVFADWGCINFKKTRAVSSFSIFSMRPNILAVRSRKNFVDSVPPINSEGVPSPTLPPQTLCVRLAHNWPWLTHPQWEHLFGVIA